MNSVTASARKDASHVTPRPSPRSPLKACNRAHHYAPGCGREPIAATRANSHNTAQQLQASPQPQPQPLGARQWVVGSKVGKLNRSTARAGLWLGKVNHNVECRGARPSVTLAHRPRRLGQGRKPTTPVATHWPAKSIHHDIASAPGCPRIPLADITPPASLDADGAFPNSGLPPDVTMVDIAMELPARYRAPSLPAAIDLLTEDEARRLLLRAAQSNLSLAAAIRQIALSRADAARSTRSAEQMRQESFLVDTFVEDPMSSGG
ncbi:hypothetical protein C8A03DRAFT_19733 [Achaetomium macrosporum]|uniref:Uncharacterized protein n=1 Tax=Achaetomium macrosporum TaxID=79813 RepID=A0AAN7C132_9PEZI|nr:hypothetical protein C8A03DRAFT_19733 [Achaetomium macrosporum]